MKLSAKLLGLIFLLLLVLSGCVSKHTPTPVPTNTIEPSPTATATPVLLSPTALEPTKTPMLLPTATPTLLPKSAELLGVENAGDMQVLEVIGKGSPVNVFPALNGMMTIVQTPYGFYFYDESLAQLNFVESSKTGTDYGYETLFQLSDDTALLAVALPDYSIQVWDLSANKLVQTLTHTAELPKYPPQWFDENDFRRPHSMVFSPANRMFAAGFGDGNLEVLNLETGETRQLLATDVSPMPEMLGFSSDDTYLASGTASFSPSRPEGVAIWSVPEQKLLLRIPKAGFLPPRPFSPDNKILLTYAPVEAGVVYLWDAGNGTRIAKFGTNLPAPPEFSADGKLLLINGGEQVRRVSDGKLLDSTPTPTPYEPNMPSLRAVGHFKDLQGGRWTDSETITAWGSDGNPYLWKPRSGQVSEISQPLESGTQIVGSLDGKMLAFCAGRDLLVLDTLAAAIKPLSVCLDGSVLSVSNEFIARGARSMLDLLNLTDGEVYASMQGHNHPIYRMTFSPDNAYLASGSEEASSKGVADAFMWNVNPPQRVMRQEQIPYIVHALAISPDNSLLAIGYGEGYVRIVRVADEYTLAILNDPARSITFSPNGSLFATGSLDGKIRIYDSATWELLNTLEGHLSQVVDVSFSPDGYNLLSTSSDGTLRLWGIP